MTKEIVNAIIRKAVIEIEDHGLLTAWLVLDCGNGIDRRFGSYALYSSSRDLGAKYTGAFIRPCLETASVSE